MAHRNLKAGCCDPLVETGRKACVLLVDQTVPDRARVVDVTNVDEAALTQSRHFLAILAELETLCGTIGLRLATCRDAWGELIMFEWVVTPFRLAGWMNGSMVTHLSRRKRGASSTRGYEVRRSGAEFGGGR